MGEYFKPLRRKLGVGTLVLACVFMDAWIISRIVLGDTDVARYTVEFWQCVGDNGIYCWIFTGNGFSVIACRGGMPFGLILFSWQATIPLTLLSAWLLLSKLRSKTEPATTTSP